jgi:cytosine/creatinine deaminase
MIPTARHYWLTNARVPVPLLVDPNDSGIDSDQDLALVDLEIKDGIIAQITAAGELRALDALADVPIVDLQQRLVWCCFVDLHTHLDKGHIWPRTSNLDGSFASALTQTQTDREQHWQTEDVYRRMEFGLKCCYAHGTKAVRTHIDTFGEQAALSLAAFKPLQQEWRERIQLQAVSLVSLDYFLTPAGERLADQMAEVGGLLGGLPQMSQDLDQQLDRVFDLAIERGLNLDFHTDESGNPQDITLQRVAAAALRHQFSGQFGGAVYRSGARNPQRCEGSRHRRCQFADVQFVSSGSQPIRIAAFCSSRHGR